MCIRDRSIPGHGGITDRVDCQFLMGSFMNLYYETFISENRVTVETVLSTILMNFNERQIVGLIKLLNEVLYSNGFLPESSYKQLTNLYNI